MQKKEILKTETGEALVYINLSYPAFDHPVLGKKAEEFYQKAAEGFCGYAKRKLLPKALAAKCAENFKPFSAVMSYTCKEDGETALVRLNTFVFDGQSRINGKTATQKWDKKTGFLKPV